MQKTKESFLCLLRIGIGHNSPIPIIADWNVIETIAAEQGLSAVVVDGLEKLADNQKPPKPVLLQWIGEVLQGYECRYEQYRKAIAELAGFYNEHGFKMMVLKGYACSLDWPKPEHRPCGDIDIWLFGKQKEADAALLNLNVNDSQSEVAPDGSKSDKNLPHNHIEIDNSHHHHSVFVWQGFTVENHYDFINTHAHRSSRRFEEKLKELAWKGYQENIIGGATVYLPGADFNFLFLLRHMANHFVGKEMTLRQLLDWALLIDHHHEEIDWKEDLTFLEENGLLRYFNLMALICVERLGFSRDIFHCELKEDELKERVFNDIIEPEYNVPLGYGLLRIMVGKTRRWWSNRWKHRLCYPDSLLSGFVYGVWAKIQKPAHFLH